MAGKLGDKPVEYSVTADLPEKPTESGDDFVAPLWAARKIGFLLQEIRLHGANDERIGEVVRLSKRFGIVTEYTTFLATAADDLSTGAALGGAIGMARKQMEAAAEREGGQVGREPGPQRSTTPAAGRGRGPGQHLLRPPRQRGDRGEHPPGRPPRSSSFATANGLTAKAPASSKTRVVKLDGKEYQDLVRNNRDFAQSQQLGWAVQMNVGDERIVVEKNGQQEGRATPPARAARNKLTSRRSRCNSSCSAAAHESDAAISKRGAAKTQSIAAKPQPVSRRRVGQDVGWAE